MGDHVGIIQIIFKDPENDERNILKKGIREALDRESWKSLLFFAKGRLSSHMRWKSLRRCVEGVDMSELVKGSKEMQAVQGLKNILRRQC